MAKTRGTLKFYDMNSPEIEATTAGQQTEYKGRKGRGTLTFTEIEPIPMPETTVKPETEEDAASGGGAQKDNKKFDAGQYAGDAGRLFLNGVVEGFAATGAAVENWIGKGLDKLFPGAGFEGSGLFNVLYNGRPDWKWAGENGLVGIKQDREYNQESLQENADRIDSKVLKKAAEFGGDIAYGLGNAAPMAATAMATGGASAAASLTKEGLMKTGAEVVEKSGVLNSLSKAAREMLTSQDYWTSFASEVGMDYYDALDNGATEDEALRYALSSAGLNSVIEIGGGIQKIPEKPTFKTWLKSAHEEGMEEIQQGVVSRLLENVVYKKGNPIASVTDENAVFNPVTALGEYAGGAAVGGILSGGQQLAQRGINDAQYRKAYGNNAQALVDESLELNPDNELAKKAQKKLDAGKKLTGSELRQLVEQNETDIMDGDRATIQTAVEDRLTELGETENVPQVAEAIARQAAGERIIDAEKTLLEGNERAQQVLNELNPENIRVGATDEAWTGQIGTERINRAAYNRGIQENGVTGAKYNAETGKLDAIVKDDQGKIQTVPAEKAELSPLQEELFDWAEDLKEAGPVMVGAYQATQNLELYAKSFRLAYEYGKAHVPVDYVENSEAVNYLHPVQLKLAYEEGRKAQQRQTQATEKKINSGGTRTAAGKKKPAVSLRGATVGGTTYAPVDRKAMNRRQWASVEAMRTFSKATGVDVVFYQSQANEKGEYEGANGFYRDGTIYLDINAGRNRTQDVQETAVLKTAAHELTHFIQQNSPTQYEELKQFVVERLVKQEGVSFEDLVTDKQVREPELSYNEAVDELVADACEMMLKDSKAAEQLAKENRSLARRIADWLRKWVRSIKTAMEDLKAERPESAAMMQYAEELQKLWDEALVTAARNNRGVGTGRAQYSIRTMDGETMTVLDTENDTRSFDAAEEYLKALVDTEHPFATILADAQPVYIGKDLPGEYRSSEYTKGMEAKLRPVKMQAATNLDEMLLLAENGEWRENVKDKHKTDAQNGWYRYDARFAVPILNEKKAVDHYTVYGGTLLIRNDADGKSYLYDLVDIKREKRISTASFSARGHSEVLAPKPSQTQYMQNAEGSQAEKSGQMQERSSPQINGSSGKSGARRGNASVNSIRQLSENSQEENYTKVQNQQREPRLPDRDYSYDALTRKPDMTLTVVNDRVKYQPNSVSRKNILEWGIANGKKVGRSNENGNAVVRVKDTGEEVILSKAGLRHGLDRRFAVNAPVVLRAGEILQNAIRINELTPKKDTVDASYVLVGAAKNKNNEPYIVQFVVNRASNEVTSVDVLYAINAKKEPAALLPEITGEPATLTDSSISISNLLDYVNRYFPDILPEDVLKHYGHDERPAGELGESALFQQRESRLSDRDVLRMAAGMAGSDRSNRWAVEDKNRLELLEKRMLLLDEINAELAALQEERATILSGRKKSELKGEDRNELIKTENRIQIAKDQIEREEARAFNLVSMDVYKPLLKKARSIVEQDAATRARTEYREKREEAEQMAVTRRKVERTAKRLLEYMNTNTDKKHIPEALKKPIGELLESLNFFSNSARRGGYTSRADLKYYEAMQGLQAALATQRAFDDTGEGTDVFKGYLDLPAGFESLLAVHVERVKNVVEKHPLKTDVLKMMDLGDLRDLDVILSVMSRSVTKMNEMFIKRRFAYVADAAEDSIFAMQRLGQHQDKPGERFALWDNTLPWYAFQRFGEGGKAVFEGLQDGWDKLAFNMKTILDFKQGLISDPLARKWDTETHKVELTDPDGSKVTATLTTAQLMSLYCLSKRKQALGHLLGGGIRPDAIEVTNTLGDKIKKKKWNQDKQFKLTEESLGQLLKLLTPEQIKVADAMQKFMTEQGSAWGNAISMERFGYRAFTEQNYFPIETDAQDRQAKTGDTKDGSLYRLQNISAVKPLVKNANNALVLRGIFDVFANHTADMAKYNALVLPILDAQKWYNYKYASKNEAGQISTRTVQRAMTKAYGGAANNYVIKYLQDLNGVKESGDRGDTLAKKMISNYKRAMVAANMRVALLQPTAYARASAVLDYEYLAKAFADKTSTKQATEEMLQHSGIALWKSLGFFDTDVGRSIRDQIKGKSSKLENFVDKTMVPAEKGDEITWARLWRACKLEVQDKQKLTGDELLKATAERFREVVYRTQVVDSTMTRSHTMRSNGTLSKMATSFMSEPTMSYNMVMESTRQTVGDAKRMGMRVAIRRNWKALGRSLQAYVMSAAVTAIVESLYDALRDPDDDEYMEKVWKAFGGEKPETAKDQVLSIIFGLNGNFAGNINPIGKVPYLRDVVSIFGGYSNGRMDTEAVANLKKAIDIWDEVIRLQTGDLDKATKTTYYGNMTTYGMIYPTAKALSQLTGLPGSAAMREVTTAWNTTVGTVWPALKMRTYEDKKLREAWENYGKDSGVSYAVMYRAIQDLKEFESDRDADGNAISGSLKAKYVEYIRGMGMTRAQEKAVWEAAKNSSWSDKGTPWG